MATLLNHPIQLLQTFEDNYRCQPPKVTLKTTKIKLQDVKADYEESLERMKMLFKSSLLAHNITDEEEKQKLNDLFTKTRKRLCLSLISPEFEQKYESELRQITGSRDFFSLLDQIIGTLSDKDKMRLAKQQLQEISRNSDEEETFQRFLARVTILAKEASKGCDILCKHFEDETFDRSLTPELRRYLLDQGMSDKDSKTTAEYLDKMKKHKRRAAIREVSANELLLQEQVNALTAQISSLPALIKDSLGTSNLSEKINGLERELAHIKKIGSRDDQRDGRRHYREDFDRSRERYPAEQRQSAYQPQETNSRNGPYPANFEIGPNGYPYRCHKCGILGHRKFDCRGTSLTCRICNRRGHIQAACPEKLSKN